MSGAKENPENWWTVTNDFGNPKGVVADCKECSFNSEKSTIL